MRQMLEEMTRRNGLKYDSPQSKYFIKDFIDTHNIDIREIEKRVEDYVSFNDFFCRKLLPGMRPIAAPSNPGVAVSPADCRCLVFPTISAATEVWIKGRNFNLQSMLGDDGMARYYTGGSLFLCRLAPQDYHRFHAPVDGVLGPPRNMDGTFFSVNPMAVKDENIDVFTENKRVSFEIESPSFGFVCCVCVGAANVGSIRLSFLEEGRVGTSIQKGDETGWFQFGGSTVIVLFRKGSIEFDEDLLRNSRKPMETLIRMGMAVGRSTMVPEGDSDGTQ